MTHFIDAPPVEDLTSDSRSAIREATLGRIERTRQRRRGLRLCSLAGGGALAAGLLIYPGISSPAAYASWSAIPAAGGVTEDSDALRACLSVIPAGTTAVSRDATPQQVVVSERRGDFVAALVTSDASQAVCIYGEEDRTGARTVQAPLEDGELLSIDGNAGSMDEGQGMRYLYGQVDAQVKNVEVELEDGLTVTASVDDGYYLAWWPSGSDIAAVRAMDLEQRTLRVLNP